MRILHITYDFGQTSAVFRLASRQRDEGHDVFIYCKRGLFCLKQQAFIQSSRLRLAKYVALNRLDKVLSKACSRDVSVFCSPSLTPASLPSYLRSQPWSVVHIHWLASNFCSLKSALNLPGKKFVHLHDLWILLGMIPHSICSTALNDTGRFLQRVISTRHKRLIISRRPVLLAPSRWAQLQATSLLEQDPVVRIIPGSIPSDFCPGDAGIAASWWPHGRRRLLHVMSGQDPLLKGLDIILEALAEIPSATSQAISLIVVGAQAEAITSVNGTIVKFIRPVGESDMINLYRAADYTVVWSRAETFSQSAAESLACGTPIITHRILPCAGFCDEREGSIVANNDTSSECASALQQVLRQKPPNKDSGQSLYHAEVSTPSATTCYDDGYTAAASMNA